MGYDLGDVVPLAATVTDSSGAAADADTISLTITLPDGTTVTPSVTNPPASTGQYSYDYASVQAGRHVVRWTASGPTWAHADVFYVHQGATLALVSLADAKRYMNIAAANTTHDDELRDAILTASDVVEGIVGSVARRTVTETHSGRGGPALALREPPALSITSVTENGVTLSADDYALSSAGVLYRVSGYVDGSWTRGRQNIAVTYMAGRTIIPPGILDGVKELLRINFRPQLGGNYSPFDRAAAGDTGTVRLGFYVPNRVMELLAPHVDPGGIA